MGQNHWKVSLTPAPGAPGQLSEPAKIMCREVGKGNEKPNEVSGEVIGI